MITFPRAPRVNRGDRITSSEADGLARALNARLISGLGDGSWRMVYWWLSVFSQIRNPSLSGASPSVAEYFEAWQMLASGAATWEAGPGEPEGANLASQLNAFVLGAEAFNLDDESTRASAFPSQTTDPTPLGAWELAKAQRGGYDPVTGALASPAFTLAREHFKIRYSRRGMNGNAYGGWLPSPEVSSTGCDDPNPDDGIPAPINYLYKFTRIAGGEEVLTFPGSCQPAEGNAYPDHVAGIVELPSGYYVFRNNGTFVFLPAEQWDEGPYTGNGVLQRTANDALPRLLYNFVREFRGDSSQLADDAYHLQEAFDFSRFFGRQYHLAPARGVENGSGGVDVEYPQWQMEASDGMDRPAGTLLDFAGGGHAYEYATGFVITAVLIWHTILTADTDIQVVDGDMPVASFAVHQGSEPQLVLFEQARAPGSVTLRLTRNLSFMHPDGWLRVEATEILAYKPQIHDAYVLLRIGTASSSAPDGTGVQESAARATGERYFNHGCILARSAALQVQQQPAPSAVWDAARRWSRHVRILRRQEFSGYAVESGRSILWFRRLHATTGADLWDGIGPQSVQVSVIKPGIVYKVIGGPVTYNGSSVSGGGTFTGVDGVTSFTGGDVFEWEGIRTVAPPRGVTNEWVLGVELKGYRMAEESIWKSDAYSDLWPFVNRCHMDSPEVASDPPLRWHALNGQTPAYVPQTPPGYHYAQLSIPYTGSFNVNQIECEGEGAEACEDWRRRFYQSCRIYEPDLQIRSVTFEVDGPVEYVRVELDGRLHHCPGAPESIARSIDTWDVAALHAEAEEEFRSTENGLREYLLHQAGGAHCSHEGPGNQAAHGNLYALGGDAPEGSCYPHFRLCQLVARPYHDPNADQTPVDAHFLHDMTAHIELLLRAMCEGFVDGETSAAYACQMGTVSVFDYSYRALLKEAFGNKWFPISGVTRPDNPQSFGFLPNTPGLAADFNRLAAAIDLLYRVRVMLPMALESRPVVQSATRTTTAVFDPDETPLPCNVAGTPFGAWTQEMGPEVEIDWELGTWGPGLGGDFAERKNELLFQCDGASWTLRTTERAVQWRWSPRHVDAALAVPETWRDMIDTDLDVLASVVIERRQVSHAWTMIQDAAEFCDVVPGWAASNGSYMRFPEVLVTETKCRWLRGELRAESLEIPQTTAFAARLGQGANVECPIQPVNTSTASIVTGSTAVLTVRVVDP